METEFIPDVQASVICHSERVQILREKFPNSAYPEETNKVKDIIIYLDYFRKMSSTKECSKPVTYWEYLCVDLLRLARRSLPKGKRLGGMQNRSIKRVAPKMLPLPRNYSDFGVDKFKTGVFKSGNYNPIIN